MLKRNKWYIVAIISFVFLAIGFHFRGVSADLSFTSALVNIPKYNDPPQNLNYIQKLKQISNSFDAAPINARIDHVWKLIPGLNGVQLDLEKSLKEYKPLNPGASPLVFRQIPPEVLSKDMVAEPIYRGNPKKRQMAMMFNVAWGEEFLPKILGVLEKYHVKATFFVDGSWAKTHVSELQSLVNAGMEIGSHGYRHHLFGQLSRTQMIEDLTKTNRIVGSSSGVKINLFAPPAGDFNPLTVRVAAGLGMKTVLWTIDTIDWKRPSSNVISARVFSKKAPGALILMHPTAPTAAALPSMISHLQSAGYQLVTVGELISVHHPVPKTLAEADVILRRGQ